MLPAALGGLLTLVGGAVALVPAATRRGARAAAGPLLLLAVVTAAVGWGVYAAATAPELALSGSLLTPLLRLPPLALGPRTGIPLAAVAAAGIVLLLVCATLALRQRLAAAARPERALWAAAVALAASLTAWPLDPWYLLTLALGLAAAGWMPSRMATTRLAGLAGSATGAVVFVVLTALPVLAPSAAAWLDAATRYPALLALPLGWAAAKAASTVTVDEPARGDTKQPVVA
jgi:hypothetical protein